MSTLAPAPHPRASGAEQQPRTGPQHDVRAGSSPAPGLSHGHRGRAPLRAHRRLLPARWEARPPPRNLSRSFGGGGERGWRGSAPPSCHRPVPPGQAGAVQPAAGAGTPRCLRRALPAPPARSARGSSSAVLPALRRSRPISSHPVPSREAARRLPKLPEVRTGSAASPRPCGRALPPPAALPCPTLRGTRGRSRPLSPSAAGTRQRRDPAAGSGARRPALPPAEQMPWRREEPRQPQLPLPQPRTRRCCARLRAGRAAGCAARRAGRLPGAAPYF